MMLRRSFPLATHIFTLVNGEGETGARTNVHRDKHTHIYYEDRKIEADKQADQKERDRKKQREGAWV